MSHEAQIIRVEEQVAEIDAWWLHGSTSDEEPGRAAQNVVRGGGGVAPLLQRPEPVVARGGPQRPQLRLVIPLTTLLPAHLGPVTTTTPSLPMDRASPPAYDSQNQNGGREVEIPGIDVGRVRFAFDRVANWIMGTRAAILAAAGDEEAAVAVVRKDDRRPPTI